MISCINVFGNRKQDIVYVGKAVMTDFRSISLPPGERNFEYQLSISSQFRSLILKIKMKSGENHEEQDPDPQNFQQPDPMKLIWRAMQDLKLGVDKPRWSIREKA